MTRWKPGSSVKGHARVRSRGRPGHQPGRVRIQRSRPASPGGVGSRARVHPPRDAPGRARGPTAGCGGESERGLRGVGEVPARLLQPGEYIESWLAYGPPGAVVEKIRASVEVGCTTPILRFASWDQKGQLARGRRRDAGRARAPVGLTAGGAARGPQPISGQSDPVAVWTHLNAGSSCGSSGP
jgi:hypothetical protein